MTGNWLQRAAMKKQRQTGAMTELQQKMIELQQKLAVSRAQCARLETEKATLREKVRPTSSHFPVATLHLPRLIQA